MSAEKIKEMIEVLNTALPKLEEVDRVAAERAALSHLLGLTDSPEGISTILSSRCILSFIFQYASSRKMTELAKMALDCFINIAAEEEGAKELIKQTITTHSTTKNEMEMNIIKVAVDEICNSESKTAKSWAMLLSNLSRVNDIAENILYSVQKDEFSKLVKAFVNLNFNQHKEDLHYLGSVFCNLTQVSQGREIFCDPNKNWLEKLLPFVSYKESYIRRHGIIGLLKNICFDPKYHKLMMDENDDILSALMYPLMGSEEYTDEENDMLPIQLQYFGEDKIREESSDLRKMLLETLFQLCSIKESRIALRSKGVYNILREYHMWETDNGNDNNALLMCENVIGILIREEEEIGVDSFKDITIPDEVMNKLSIEEKQ